LFFFDRVFSVEEGETVGDGGKRLGLPRSNDSIVKIGSAELSEESEAAGVTRPDG
jgi:hypothetical protein